MQESREVIPLVDLSAQYAAIRPEIDTAIQRVLDSGAFILGHEVEQFENAFAAYCDVRHAIGVASGTAALHLALLGCGIGPGDEVITTPLTFAATVEAIAHAGAHPVFADIDPRTCNIDPSAVAAAIGTRTRAIVGVHLYGIPIDVDPLHTIAERHRLLLIEDAAQAHGARYRGQRIGGLGAAAGFSFYPGKNLGAYGDAGIVTTNDADIAARVRRLRDHGRSGGKYRHTVIGYGERLDALQAAVLRVKLHHLDEWNTRRRRAADRYRELLAGLPAVPQAVANDVEAAYHLFVVRLSERDRVLAQLHAMGIGAGVHYPVALHMQPAYAHLGYGAGSFPHAERAAAEVLSLPLYPEITEAQLVEVASALRRALEKAA